MTKTLAQKIHKFQNRTFKSRSYIDITFYFELGMVMGVMATATWKYGWGIGSTYTIVCGLFASIFNILVAGINVKAANDYTNGKGLEKD
jgi:hypothetical protein